LPTQPTKYATKKCKLCLGLTTIRLLLSFDYKKSLSNFVFVFRNPQNKIKQKQNKTNFPHSTALPHSSRLPDFPDSRVHTDDDHDDRGWQRKKILAVMSDDI
jgi:hypothetical protein